MLDPLLRTKLIIPPVRPNLVPRPQLIERLNQGIRLGHKLTLVSAPAGFGKTTLVSEWLAACQRPAAWLSLDESDNDPTRFLTYLVSALRTLTPDFGEGVLAILQSTQSSTIDSILTALLNEITTQPGNFVLVLDDFHVIESHGVERGFAYIIDNMPYQMHLVITTREDPRLPLARLRVGNQLTELRIADLRFSTSEAVVFLNEVMDLNLSGEDIVRLEARTEGWVAGLQLAALALQGTIVSRGHGGATDFINSFTGSHHFVLDYLLEEVLGQQPERVQSFLLNTAILDRMTGSLCDALTGLEDGQESLEYLQRVNLFVVPLDGERRWYRYHHLFADLLRQRLNQLQAEHVAELHVRASAWYEENGMAIEAFQHAAAINDIDRAERLVNKDGVPLQYRGEAAIVLRWLASLPAGELDARPGLWVTYASMLNLSGQPVDAARKLQAAEAALQATEPDEDTNDLFGQIAAIRAMMAVSVNQVETIIAQSRQALQYLHPDNLTVRTITTWTLGRAYQLQGDRTAAARAYADVFSISQASGDIVSALAATTGLGSIQESQNQLFLAAESYRRGLQLFGDKPPPYACETCLALARILYEWNDLDAALQLGQQSLQLARQIPSIDTFAVCGVLLSRLKVVHGDASGAAILLAEADQYMREHNFSDRMPEIVATQVLTLIRQGNLETAARLAQSHELPISQARVQLAQGDPLAALVTLESLRQQAEEKGYKKEQLQAMVLQAIAHDAHGDTEKAIQLLGEALALAEPGGFIRLFVDEGPSMAQLLSEAAVMGISAGYLGKLQAAFKSEQRKRIEDASLHTAQGSRCQPLIEPLTPREGEVLKLIAAGYSNPEIAAQLVIAVTTVKTHIKNIYGKLQVTNRFQAAARAKELNLP